MTPGVVRCAVQRFYCRHNKTVISNDAWARIHEERIGERKMSAKSGLFMAGALCAATALTAAAAPAAAQETEASDPNVDSGEVIVTAQRREERLQDVPISVTALSAAQLESRGVASTSDLTMV